MSEAIVEKSRVFNDNDILRHQIDILCFLPDKSDKEQVETVLARLELKDNSIRRGTIKEATKYLSKNPSPRLLVVDIGISETPLASILALAEVCEPQTRVVAIGTADTVDLYRDLIQAGVSDYLVRPIPDLTLERSLQSALGSGTNARDRAGLVIGVLGATGGVGATTFAANLTSSMVTHHKRRCTLVDLDFNASATAQLLGMTPSTGVAEALKQPDRIDASLFDQVEIARSERFAMISTEEPLNRHVEIRQDALAEVLRLATRAHHAVILDLPRRPSTHALDAAALCDVLLILCDGTIHSTREAARWRLAVRALRNDPVKQEHHVNVHVETVLIETRLGKKSGIDQQDLERLLGAPFDYTVPYSPTARRQGDEGQLVIEAGRSAYGRAIESIGDDLLGGAYKRQTRLQESKKKQKGNGSSFFKRFFRSRERQEG